MDFDYHDMMNQIRTYESLRSDVNQILIKKQSEYGALAKNFTYELQNNSMNMNSISAQIQHASEERDALLAKNDTLKMTRNALEESYEGMKLKYKEILNSEC